MKENNSYKQRVQKWLPTPAHYLLLVRVGAWLIAAPLLVRALSMNRLMALVTPCRARPLSDPDFTGYAHTITAYSGFLLRQNPKNLGKNCLRKSLVLYRFLRLRAVPARLLIGVRKVDGQLTGHAWVEVDGKKIRDPQSDVNYSVTFSYPPAGQNMVQSNAKTGPD